MGHGAVKSRGPAAASAALALALGALAVVAQSVWVRELSLLWFGSELSWGMTLSGWLVGVSVGAAAGGAALRRIRPEALATACAILLAATLPAGLWLLRSARGLLAPGPGEFIPLPGMLALTGGVAGATGLWIGALFPAGCALAAGATGGGALAPPQRTIGVFFAAEAVGTLIAGACFTFWWVGRFDAVSLSAALSASVLIALSLACAFRARGACGAASAGISAAAGAALIVLCATGWTASFDRAALQRRWNDLTGQAGTPPEHLAGTESPFGRIDLGRLADQWMLYLNCQPAGTFPNRRAIAPYVHLAALQSPRLRRVLLIGQATGEIAEILRAYPAATVESVELDRRVHEVLAEHLRPAPAPPTALADGRHFLQASRGRYDVIILATPDPTSITTARFYTREFFQIARSRLSEEGVLAFWLAGPAEKVPRQLADYLGSIYRAGEGVFAETVWTWGNPAQVFAARNKGVLTTDPEELLRRYGVARAVPRPPAPGESALPGEADFDPEIFHSLALEELAPPRLAEFRRALAASPPDRVNSDDRPVAMFLSIERHEAMLSSLEAGPAGPRRWSLLSALGQVRLRHALLAAGALAAIVWAAALAGRLGRPAGDAPSGRRTGAGRRVTLAASLATTGAAGMGLEIILLAAFQNLYGYVYSHIALIVAVYMAGVAAGGLWAARGASGASPEESAGGRRAWTRLVILDAALAAGCLAVPGVLALLGRLPPTPAALACTEGVILAMLSAVGLAGGIALPLAAGLYRRSDAQAPAGLPAGQSGGVAEPADRATGRIAAAVDAADCLGGAGGAFATGLILLPLMGWTAACCLMALAKSVTLVGLALARPGR